MTRRELLRRTGNGFGMLGLASLLAEKSEAAGALEARSTHFPAKAKHVIFLFLNGGPSHVDTTQSRPWRSTMGNSCREATRRVNRRS